MPGGSLDGSAREVAEGKPFIVFLVGYSHIDSEWLWGIEEAFEVCRKTFKNVVRLMEGYADFTFMQSSSLYYEVIELRCPKLYEKMIGYMREGRWRVAGAPFLEFDANIPSGESLIRHLLQGRSYFKDDKSRLDIDALFLPDSFGFPATFPKLLKGFGVKYFATYKLAWNDSNEPPYNLFRWRDPYSGSEVIAYILPGSYSDYLSDIKRIIWNIFNQWRRQRISVILQVYGRGDHGGGPEEEELLNIGKWAEKWHPIILLKHGGMDEFFGHVRKNYYDKLPEVEGELYLEFHRGVYTTGVLVKKLNRLNENLVLQVEKLYSLLGILYRVQYPRDLKTVWKDIMLNQGHDSLPSTVPREIFEKIAERGFTSFSKLLGLLRAGLSRLGKEGGLGYVIFNPNSWSTSIYLRVKGEVQGACYQEVGDEKIIYIKDLPPFGFKIMSGLGDEPSDKARVEDHDGHYLLENKYLRVIIDKKTGWISGIYDKINDREVLREPIRLRAYRDYPMPSRFSAASAALFDAWEAYYNDDLNKYFRKDLKTSSHWVASRGPLYVSVISRYSYGQLSSGRSSLELEVGLYADKPYVEVFFRSMWRAKHRFLKLLIPLKVRSDKAIFETSYGVVERLDACRNPSPLARARYEVCGHRWVDISDGKYGVAVINDSRYGFSWCDGVLGVSLLRSPTPPLKDVLMKFIESFKEMQRDFRDVSLSLLGRLGRAALSLGSWILTMVLELIYLGKLRPVDHGYHSARIWIYPHKGTYSEPSVPSYASELNTIYVVQRACRSSGGKNPRSFSLMTIHPSDKVHLTAFKPSEKGKRYVVRLFNASPEVVKAEIRFNLAVERVCEADLAENPLREMRLKNNSVSAEFRPLEVKTFLLEARRT